MNYDERNRYLIDTNALAKLGEKRWNLEIFHKLVRIPDEVLRESEGFIGDKVDFSQLEYKVNYDVLLKLIKVLENIDGSETDLIDLFRNQGSADPVILACALDAKQKSVEKNSLFPLEWIVVTDDKGVQRHAEQLEIKVVGSEGFMAILDRAPLFPELELGSE